MTRLAIALLLCLPLLASADEVAGVDVPEKAHVQTRNLVLNGAGIRTRFLFKVYVAALYLQKKQTTAEAVLADKGIKRVELHMLHKVDGDEFLGAFEKAIHENHTDEEYAPLDVRMTQLARVFHDVGEVKPGDVITLDYAAARTEVSVNGKVQGRIKGKDFYQALLKIWLGERPVNEDLKKGLLGG